MSEANNFYIKQATTEGWIKCCDGGVADLSYPNSRTRRGRVEDEGRVCPTITTSPELYVIWKNKDSENNDNKKKIKYRIRKLVPIECFKLMGMTKEDCEKAAAVGTSNTQLYKCAGNGLITNCITLIMEHLFKAQYDPEYQCFDERFLSGEAINSLTTSPHTHTHRK